MLGKEWKLFVLLSVLFILALACSQSAPTPSEAPEVFPAITQQAGELPSAESSQHRVFIPGVNTSDSASAADREVQIPAEFDPHVIIEADRLNLIVGESVTITGRPVQIGRPYYSLIARDEGVQEDQPVASVSYDNVLVQGIGASRVLEVVSAQADPTKVTFVLRAREAGVTTVTIHASGEVYLGYPGPGTVVGDGSGSVLITVTGR